MFYMLYAIHNTQYDLRKITYEFISKNMQNEPNLPKAQMNVNKVLTTDYENKPNWTLGENEPNTNPIKPNLVRLRRIRKAKKGEVEHKWVIVDKDQTDLYAAKHLPGADSDKIR